MYVTEVPTSAGGRRLMKVVALIVAAALVVGVVVIWSFQWISQQGGSRDDFVKTAGLWVGVITAAMTAVLGMLSAYFQFQWGKELETVKLGFNQQLEVTKTKLVMDVENLRGRLNRTLEFAKGRYAAERKAYDELLAAAYAYYYTLSTLESHRWNGEQVTKADEAMVASCRFLPAADPKDREFWVLFWQAARTLEEQASRLGGEVKETASSPIGKQRHELWSHHVKELGGKLNAFIDAAALKHRKLEDATSDTDSPTA
jgi:hypothetical protein